MALRTTSSLATVLTANRLLDGVVVFLDDDLGWSPALADARLLAEKASVDRLIVAAAANNPAEHVVGAYAIDVEMPADRSTPRPLRLRERIRAGGPTV